MPRRKTDYEFRQDVYNLVGDDYTFLDSYVNNKAKLRVKHNKCNNIYKVSPSNFIDGGSRCPFCSSKAKKTDAQFKHEVYSLVGSEYEFLDSYINSYTKIKVKHNKCGHTYKVTPGHFLEGSRCPYCAKLSWRNKLTKTNNQFQQEVFNLVGNEYTFLDHYVNNDTKIRVKHNKCGNIYEVRPTDFLSHHTRCPYCYMPKEEKIISKILNTLNIKYETQKVFPDLKDAQSLSYDFYIPDQSILIEYQGIQHYQPVNLWGGEGRFKLQQKHDQMKADYAKNNGYSLIAVPYTEDTFSKIKKYLINRGLSN